MMEILNVEFKAATNQLEELERILQEHHPIFVGEDHQLDTYFNVFSGRLKLREGNIENAVIQYERVNIAGSKPSAVLLYQHLPESDLKKILTNALGIKAVVDKKRRIYFIDNVKFHFDTVKGLGRFVEVEAIDKDGLIGKKVLQEQCDKYAALFNVMESDYIAASYSDMVLLSRQNSTEFSENKQ